MLSTSLGRFVLRKTALEVLGTARGQMPRAIIKNAGTFFHNTDRLRLVDNIFLKVNEILSKRTRMIKGCNYSKIFHKMNNF